ncbi:MAG: alanine racemase [Deltaproteobacteria bacterium]|jgi:alanine racemase|nr:alanine racemase [Deltaproteobacteria bacterium]
MAYGRPVWAEVNLEAIAGNMRRVKSLLGEGVRYCAVVKADAYGHGAVPVARKAVEIGADYLAVAMLQEGIALREAGFVLPILLLGYTPPELAALVVGNACTQTIYTREQAEALSGAAVAQGRKAKVHVKIDSGMSRLGIKPGDAAEFCRWVSGLPGLELEGIFTHFATADDDNAAFMLKQFAEFQKALEAVRAAGVHITIRHCANSAATLLMPQMHLDMARPGIVQYGLSPTGNCLNEQAGKWPIDLVPALRFKARLSMVKEIQAGTSVSYGAAFTATRSMLIGTVPVGYADGYTRMLSGKTDVLVRGRRAPLVGRICMDQCMIDLSGLPEWSQMAAGEEVLLFGGPELPVDEIAATLGTINYEVVCMIGKRVPRIYK